MRKIFLTAVIIIMPLIGLAYTSPGKPTGFVNDFANILSVQDKQVIETKLQSLKQTTNAEVSVVTISSLGNDETIETYAPKLFQEWGIGVKGKDNGLLILVASNDRQARIEVGYGLEGSITDIQSGIIVRNVMIPAFKNGDYSTGINGAVDAVIAIITKSPEAAQYLQDVGSDNANNSGSSSNSDSYLAPLFFIAFIFLNALAKILGKTKSWWLGGVVGAIIGTIIGFIWGFVFAGIGSIVILTILGLIFDYFVSKNPPKSGSPGGFFPIFFGGGRGGSGGFGGGGGFGGFGGGMSGGGGASGRW